MGFRRAGSSWVVLVEYGLQVVYHFELSETSVVRMIAIQRVMPRSLRTESSCALAIIRSVIGSILPSAFIVVPLEQLACVFGVPYRFKAFPSPIAFVKRLDVPNISHVLPESALSMWLA